MTLPIFEINPNRRPGIGSFFMLLVLCFVPSLTGILFPPNSWFDTLAKPLWNPPSWVFGPVWTFLYFSMALSIFLVLRQPRRLLPRAVTLFLVQLGLNALWTPLFFGAQEPSWALINIVILDGVVLATLWTFWKIRRTAGLLLVPYQLWLLFATALNRAIVGLN